MGGGGVIVRGGMRGVDGDTEGGGEAGGPLVEGGGVLVGRRVLVVLSLFLRPVVFPDFRLERLDIVPFPLSPKEGFLPVGAGSSVTGMLDGGWRGNVRMSSSSVVDVSASVGLVAVVGGDEELLGVLVFWSLVLDSSLPFM